MSDSTPPPTLLSDVTSGAQSWTRTFFESALNSAAQQPLDAFAQIANQVWKPLTGHAVKAPQFVHPLPHAQFGSPIWTAEMLGMGLGRTADITGLAFALRGTGLTGRTDSFLNASLQEHPQLSRFFVPMLNSAVPAALYGALAVPSQHPGSASSFWRDRAVNAGTWALGGLTAGAAGEITGGYFRRWQTAAAKDAPLSMQLRSKALTATGWMAGGLTNGITKTMIYTGLGEEQLNYAQETNTSGQ